MNTNNSNRSAQEPNQQLAIIVDSFFSYSKLEDILDDFSFIFRGYLSSEESDDTDARRAHTETYFRTIKFIEEVAKHRKQ